MPLRHQFDSTEAFERALRDYFAGQALAALGPLDHFPNEYRGEPRARIVARAAYMYADALLTARK